MFQDYDSIPHQRLKAVIGSEGWGRKVATWVLIALAIIGIFFGSCYMHAKTQYQDAVRAAAELHGLDTHNNDIVVWLKVRSVPLSPPAVPDEFGTGLAQLTVRGQAERHAPVVERKYPTMGHPQTRAHTLVTDNPRNPLRTPRGRHAELPESQISSASLLRLPVGLATTLYIQRLMQERNFQQSDITPGHDDKYRRLKELKQLLPVDIYQQHNKRVHVDLLRLLRIARRAGVVTEVPLVKGTGAVSQRDHWKESDSGARAELLAQLRRFRQCTAKGAAVPCSHFKDVMRYPGSAALLYWGSFKLLRFDGHGVLFWRNGLKAYDGQWADGEMHGRGALFDKLGNAMWSGTFVHGRPVGSLDEMYTNYVGQLAN